MDGPQAGRPPGRHLEKVLGKVRGMLAARVIKGAPVSVGRAGPDDAARSQRGNNGESAVHDYFSLTPGYIKTKVFFAWL